VESVNFDRAAGYYDATRALPAAAMEQLTDLLAAELAVRQPCLEVGVGTGRFALPLHVAGVAMAGTDISGAMLRRLAANAGGVSPFPLAQADATRLPFAAGTFGSVLAVHVLHLIPDWRVAVDEAVRVLRPGGALVASFPTDNRAVGEDGGTESRRQAGGPGDAASEAGAVGLSRDAVAPWAGAMREAAARHEMARKPFGAQAPAAVAGYLAGRATARELSPVPVRTTWTLGEAIDHVERQLFSWSWPYTPAQAAAVAGDVRAWAAEAGLPLQAAHESETAVRCWAFELRS
jgi:SAM-dependent methyltransferase